MEKMTRITDLPENITMSMTPPNNMSYGGGGAGGNMGMSPTYTPSNNKFDASVPTNYVPINVHPNPYGISAQNPIMPLPDSQISYQEQSSQNGGGPYLTAEQMAELQSMKKMKLPSRDIPIKNDNYMIDEEVQPNYVPKAKLSSDYVSQQERVTEKKIEEHEKKKNRQSKIDELITEFQTPILICILYFIFQLPVVNALIFKRLSFLAIYNIDGNFNVFGLVLKSMLFGGLFYSLEQIVKFISEF